MTKNEILDLIDTLNQYKAGNVTNKGLEEALETALNQLKNKKVMATRSRIGIENENGSVNSIYCHWDGYPEYNGKILKENYSDRDKVKQLLELGDISVLKEDLDKVEAYHRDLCKTYYPPLEYRNIDSFSKQFGYEYGYVLSKEGEWLTFESEL